MDEDSVDMGPGHQFHQNNSLLHLFDVLDILGEILLQKWDMRLKDKA